MDQAVPANRQERQVLDLIIERLLVEIRDIAGHEHRIGGIAQRAAALFAEEIQVRYGDAASYPGRSVERLSAPAVSLDLNRTSDEKAACTVAAAWLEAMELNLRV
jgi:hypothetical protein